MSENKKITLTQIESATEEGSHIYLQTVLKENGLEGFQLTLIDGGNVWEGTVTEDDLDQLCVRVKQEFNSFVEQTRAAFTKDVESDANFECCFTITGENSAQLAWKKIPAPDVKFNLGSTTLKKCKNPSKRICAVLSACISQARAQQEKIHSLETENERLSSERQNELKILAKRVADKEDLEKNMYSKFAAVLNQKKARIRDLIEHINNVALDRKEASSSPTASTSKHDSSLAHKSGKNSRKKQTLQSSPENSASDNEVSPAKKEKKVETIQARVEAESSLNLGLDEEPETNETLVARRPRRQASNKKTTPARPVLPRVSSAGSSVEKPKATDRKCSLRTSGSGHSNKSSDNLDPEDLLDNF